MHDTRMRGRGPYVWKVYLRLKGDDKAQHNPVGSLIVRTTTNSEQAARGRAQIELDTDRMIHHYPAEVEIYIPLGEGARR